MDVQSSSLLSPIAPAPDLLAEERSALSHVYSDTRSNDPELSSSQPLRSPQIESQDATLVTDESILIAQIVDNLKNLTNVALFPEFSVKMLKFLIIFNKIHEF